MKAILTILFVLFIGVAAQAQHEAKEVKIQTTEISVVLVKTAQKIVPTKMTLESNAEVARLYKYKNSRIKKALKFTGKRTRATMA